MCVPMTHDQWIPPLLKSTQSISLCLQIQQLCSMYMYNVHEERLGNIFEERYMYTYICSPYLLPLSLPLSLSLPPLPSLSLPPSQPVDIHVHVHVHTVTECVQYMYTYIHCILDIQYHDVVVVCISGLCMHHHISSF